MSKHFEREIDRLKRQILSVSTMVEENLQRAVQAFTERDEKLAQYVIEYDYEIDDAEVEVEEECLKTLALHQPVAVDLRFVIAVLKINNDLERIGDLGVSIAQRALYLSRREPQQITFRLDDMADIAQSMLRHALDALVNMDVELAKQVRIEDDRIDDLHKQTFQEVQEAIRERPDQIEILINFLSVSRSLERIADHTTNIAEDVIYMNEGEIVRHRFTELEESETES